MEDQELNKLLEQAQDAFWKVVKEHFPKITTGDFPPGETIVFEEACESALLTWLWWNSPDQLLPYPDKPQITVCPFCGEEYTVENAYSGEFYDTVNEAMDLYRHKKCGTIVRFYGG